MKYFRILAPNLAIDLGTSNTLVARLDKGIVIDEPTVVALDFKKLEILAVGDEAKELIGKAPENIAAIRPLRDGVISDFDLTQAMLEYNIHKALPGISMVAPKLTICVPSGSTDVENRAIQDACLQSGARDVYLVEESLASAYGAGLIEDNTRGVMILNMGAGTTEVAVVSSYGTITSESVKKGGDDLDKAITEAIEEKYSIIIGENTAERLKKTMGTLRVDNLTNAMEISGRDSRTGMPKSVDVFASDLTSVIVDMARDIVDQIRWALEKTPPELASDIMVRGLHLTGGASQIDGLDAFIKEELGIKVRLSDNPTTDTVAGVQEIMKNIDTMRKNKGD